MTSVSKKDNTEKLILVVQKHLILYDMTLPEFKDTRKKDHLWDTVISHEMNGVNGNIIKILYYYFEFHFILINFIICT